MNFTTVTLPTARTAVSGARRASLSRRTGSVAAFRTAHAVPTAKALDFGAASIVPAHCATVVVLIAHTSLDLGVFTPHLAAGFAAITLPRAPAAILMTNGAVLVNAALAVPAPIGTRSTGTATTFKLLHLSNADIVPLGVTAKRVLFADTG